MSRFCALLGSTKSRNNLNDSWSVLQMLSTGASQRLARYSTAYAAHGRDVPGDIQAPLSLRFQRSILKLLKRLTVGYELPGTLLDIRQKARVLWQSLSLLSQLMFRIRDVTILHNLRIACVCIPRERHGYTDAMFTPPTYC